MPSTLSNDRPQEPSRACASQLQYSFRCGLSGDPARYFQCGPNDMGRFAIGVGYYAIDRTARADSQSADNL